MIYFRGESETREYLGDGEGRLGRFAFELSVHVIDVAVREVQRKQNDQSPWK